MNPTCNFAVKDIDPDDGVSCSSDIAVGARIVLTMANCTRTRLNLKALASTMASVLNVSACAVELDFVLSEEAALPGEGVIILQMLAFVPNDQVGSQMISNINSTVQLAMLLAILEGNIGEVIEIKVEEVVLLHLGSATSDPHFVMPQGQKFDFNGIAGQTYCILSDKRLHVNARFIGPSESLATKATADKTDDRTWMDQLSIMHGSDRVLVDAMSAPGTPYSTSFGTVLTNGFGRDD
eukprot:jgi/Mesvir1/11203/Mv05736-RA.1